MFNKNLLLKNELEEKWDKKKEVFKKEKMRKEKGWVKEEWRIFVDNTLSLQTGKGDDG